MATHPADPDPLEPDANREEQPNPTQLPIEPEFGPQLPPAEPEEPGIQPPAI